MLVVTQTSKRMIDVPHVNGFHCLVEILLRSGASSPPRLMFGRPWLLCVCVLATHLRLPGTCDCS